MLVKYTGMAMSSASAVYHRNDTCEGIRGFRCDRCQASAVRPIACIDIGLT